MAQENSDKECLFCGREKKRPGACGYCGLGPENPPWEATAWESGPLLSFELNWFGSLWQLYAGPRIFFKRLGPEGSIFKAWSFAFPFFVLTCLSYVGVLFLWYDKGQNSTLFPFLPVLADEYFKSQGLGWCWALSLIWLVLILGLTCILLFALTLVQKKMVSWHRLFRVLCYGLSPLALAICLHPCFLYLNLARDAVMISPMGKLGYCLLLVILPVTLSCHFLKIALEECFRLSSERATLVVLVAIFLVGLFTAFEFYR
jgi:hypothetical protein